MAKKLNVAKGTVRIVERQVTHPEVEDRWLVVWDDAPAQTKKTAIEAQQAVKARDEERVAQGADAAVTVIEWEPRTRVGKAVVAAIVNR